LLLYSSHLPLGVPNWPVILLHQLGRIKLFSGVVTGEEVEDLCKGSFSHAHPLLCFIVLLYFIFTCIILYQKSKKLESLIVVFTYLLLVLLKCLLLKIPSCVTFTSTNNSDFICTPIAPPAPAANFYEIKPALLNLVMK
jgi:hypothetical protein